jgi:PKD repeat protein
MKTHRYTFGLMILMMAWLLTACNLNSQPEQPIELTALPTATTTLSQQATLGGVPTGVAVTALPFFTQAAPPTSIGFIPPTPLNVVATATPSTISIVMLSPIPGNVIAGNVQILGSAIHPNFLQYVLEYGPEPNPSNLWYPIGGARQTPVLNDVLGIWQTQGVNLPDGLYQLRLRVYLRDGSTPQTVVNNLRVQNSAPTPVPTNTQSIPRPIAAFTVDRTSGESPLVVRFTNRSSGQITGFNWNFGDGSSSAERNPVHVFRGVGEYEVKLTVVGPGGQSNVTQVIDVYINPPTASFEYNPTAGTAPLDVQFTDRSVGQINDYLWDFGDGTRSNDRNPRHTYTAQGNYNVFLRVRGPGGTNRAFAIVTVVNPQIPAPIANFTPDNTGGNAPFNLRFSDTSTGQITNYRWEFGDGTTSSDASPIHTYEQVGIYTVKLTVSGPGGSSSKLGTINVTRAPQAPDANFTPDKLSGDAPLTVFFDNQTTGDVTSYLWEFADGTSSNEAEPTHVFSTPGAYTVRLTARGQNNLSDFAEAVINVTKPLVPPNASFSVNPTAGSAPLTVQINNQSAGDNVTYTWDFGDGTTSQTTDAVFTHLYTTNGSFTIRLTVSGPGGPNSTITANINVSDTLSASFTVLALSEPQGLSFQFNDGSSGQITAWAWDFGDGTTSNVQNPVKIYTAAGTFNVLLTVTDTFGGTSSFSQAVTAVLPPTETPVPSLTPTNTLEPTFTPTNTSEPTATTEAPTVTPEPTFTFTPEPTATDQPTIEPTATTPIPTAGFTFTVTDLSVTFQDLSVGAASWEWNFGDGVGSSIDQNPFYVYGQPGTYAVTLTVRNAGGANTTSQQVTVSTPVIAPTADFTFVADGLEVSFTDTSGTVEAWAWDFGDGSTSVEQNPVYTYLANGTYVVRLTVTRTGLTGSVTKDVVVEAVVTEVPSEADQAPILPNITALIGNLNSIANNGSGLQADVVAVVGDRTVNPLGFLAPFGDGVYTLEDVGAEVQSALDAYINSDIAGQNALTRIGAAVQSDFTASSVLNGSAACGASPLVCELEATNAAVVIISVGYRDAVLGTDIAQFEEDLRGIIDTATNRGTIPVLLTPYQRPELGNIMRNYADVIIRVGDEKQIPVVNVWRMFNELPDNGLVGNDPSIANAGPDRLNGNTITRFGENARNFAVLATLRDILSGVFGF